MLESRDTGYSLPELKVDDNIDLNGENIFCFGDYVAIPVKAYSRDSDNSLFVGVRESWKLLDEADYAAVVKGVELIGWDESVRFCASCGAKLKRTGAISKGCDTCGREYFPQLSPAIIVLVTKGEKALLVRAKTFKRPFYALVAGFVETGESLEQCVLREIKEETNLTVRNIRYFGSQSWPFPGQLMVGFTAEWESGEVEFRDGELVSGGFFDRDSVPELPTLPSISRMLIDFWLRES